MDQAAMIALAQLLAQLLPLGISTYTQIAAANQDAGLKPIQDIIAAADVNFNSIEQAAQTEINNLQQTNGDSN